MNQPPLNPDGSDQYEYRIDALIQRRAKGTDEDFQTFGLALTEDGREYLGESVDDLNSMVSTGLFEVVDGPIPGHCPNCSEKIAAALPEVTSVDPRELNRRGWTCGCEPGNYDTCDECQSACNELAGFLSRPEVKP